MKSQVLRFWRTCFEGTAASYGVSRIEHLFYPWMPVRWDNLRLDVDRKDDRVTIPLFEQGAVVRTFDTPEFRGSINPYRGCGHGCLYCFARKTHTYLDLDYGEDFDTKIVVKVNAPELLRKELAAPKWKGEHIAMGTNVDPYQRAEGRYRLMRGILDDEASAYFAAF